MVLSASIHLYVCLNLRYEQESPRLGFLELHWAEDVEYDRLRAVHLIQQFRLSCVPISVQKCYL